MVSFSILSRFAQASHLSQVRSNLQKAGFLGSWWRRGVVDIPEPITDMCTKEVLVMKFLEGDNLVDGIQQLGERAAARRGLTLDDLKREMLHKFEREGYPEPYSTVWKSTFGRPTHRRDVDHVTAAARWRESSTG